MSNYQSKPERLADLFKVLSNPHRLAILQRLASCCAPGTVCATDEAYRVCVGDLGEDLEIAPSTLSHHLKELNRVGLVRMVKKGKHTECWLDPATLKELAGFFGGLSALRTTLEEANE